MNPFRNEATIKLGEVEILLRPTFENVAAMERSLGSLVYLGHRFSKGLRLRMAAESKGLPVHTDDLAKCMPTLTELAEIIYYNQAARREDDQTKRKYSLEEIWAMVSDEGIKISNEVITYVNKIASGRQETAKPEKSEVAEEVKT